MGQTQHVYLLERLAKQIGPVLDGAGKVAHVDQVERGGIVPFLFKIVNKKLDVGRYKGRLDGAQVDTNNLAMIISPPVWTFKRMGGYTSVSGCSSARNY